MLFVFLYIFTLGVAPTTECVSGRTFSASGFAPCRTCRTCTNDVDETDGQISLECTPKHDAECKLVSKLAVSSPPVILLVAVSFVNPQTVRSVPCLASFRPITYHLPHAVAAAEVNVVPATFKIIVPAVAVDSVWQLSLQCPAKYHVYPLSHSVKLLAATPTRSASSLPTKLDFVLTRAPQIHTTNDMISMVTRVIMSVGFIIYWLSYLLCPTTTTNCCKYGYVDCPVEHAVYAEIV